MDTADDLCEVDAAELLVAGPAGDLTRRPGIRPLEILQIAHVVGEQAVSVEAPEPRLGLIGGEPVGGHGVAHLVGDADAGGAGAEDHHPVTGQGHS